MARHLASPFVMTILSGATTSEKLSTLLSASQAKLLMGAAVSMLVFAPATLPETVNPTGSYDGTTFAILDLGATAIVFAAGHATPIPITEMVDFQLKSTGAVAADRVFRLIVQMDLGS